MKNNTVNTNPSTRDSKSVTFNFRVYQLRTEYNFKSVDFTFNQLRDVKKVGWKNDVPWYCEVDDGLNWFGYCLNRRCHAHKELFIVNRGFGVFKLE